MDSTQRNIIVIGTSLGGMPALQRLCGALPPNFPAALFIVWHTPSQSPGTLPRLLSLCSPLTVSFAADNQPIHPGHIYVAPPDHHLLLTPHLIRLSHGPKENRFRPAIDPLFRSAAASFGPRVIGVVLTGLMDDGTQGLWFIKRNGGTTIAQDPLDAEAADMPASAIAEGVVDHVLPLAQIPDLLGRLVSKAIPNSSHNGVPLMEYRNDQDLQHLHPPGVAANSTPLSCPDCRGAMWQTEQGPTRFKCHVGHQFSEKSLALFKQEEVEVALWTALRVLKENAALHGTLAEKSRATGRQASTSHFERSSEDFHQKAQIIERLLRKDSVDAAWPSAPSLNANQNP